jgi:hypothetical protein
MTTAAHNWTPAGYSAFVLSDGKPLRCRVAAECHETGMAKVEVTAQIRTTRGTPYESDRNAIVPMSLIVSRRTNRR